MDKGLASGSLSETWRETCQFLDLTEKRTSCAFSCFLNKMCIKFIYIIYLYLYSHFKYETSHHLMKTWDLIRQIYNIGQWTLCYLKRYNNTPWHIASYIRCMTVFFGKQLPWHDTSNDVIDKSYQQLHKACLCLSHIICTCNVIKKTLTSSVWYDHACVSYVKVQIVP